LQIEVGRLDHVALRVRSLDEAVARWTWQFGLRETHRTDATAWLACDTEPVALELLAAPDPGPDHVAYELIEGVSLADAGDALRALGMQFDAAVDAIRFSDPEGAGVELVPYRGLVVAPQVTVRTDAVPGVHPRKLGHVNIICNDLAASRTFYESVLGLRLTDSLGDLGVWLHCNSDHHGVALVAAAQTRPAAFHHLAFDVADWGQLRVVLDHLGRNGRWLSWGPVRHGMGQNLCAYVRIPEERVHVELYCDMEQLQPAHVAREWPDDAFHSNTWGILPPRSYFRFDDVAVHWEREQREMGGEPLPPPVTAALVLHDNPRSLCAQRVRFLLAELDLGYERRLVDLRARPRAEWHLAVNPTGGVPALVDGDVRLAESIAIVRYLVARSGAYDLYPLAPAERAVVDWTIDAINDDLRLATVELSKVAWGLRVGSGLFAASPEPERVPEVIGAQAPRLERVASLLGEPPYACLARFTLADVVAAPMLHRLRVAPGALAGHPRLADWADAVCGRKAWAAVGVEAGLDGGQRSQRG
jgi:glutathione S-transferase/catechol 2,3-dioxygenase-like lactoylglutathione lyase family enzyme